MELASTASEHREGFELVDVLGGFASLVRRSPTLDGSVPVRVAQGCVPLLEGNAWGWQIALAHPIELRRRLGGWTVTASERGDAIERMTRASVPMLRADGTLRPGTWVKRLERGAVEVGRTISLFTGLFVRPRPGLRLRVSTLANRRSWHYAVAEAILDDASAFCPLVLEVVPSRDAEVISLAGELATLAVLPAETAFSRCTLADAPEVTAAHVRFYDGAYFETKRRGAVARKYRDTIVKHPRAAGGEPVRARIVEGGPTLVEPASPTRLHRADGPVAAPPDTPPDRLVVRNAVSFTATFDGYKVTIEPAKAELERYAAEVRACWQFVLATCDPPAHDGALLYLTKYFTPHPPGEPHFFVKPCALVETSPGTSTVIDGRHGLAYDVMRGVVRTDSFHAVPAVFQLWRPGASIEVPRGAPLADLFVVPRALDDVVFAASTAGVGGAWA